MRVALLATVSLISSCGSQQPASVAKPPRPIASKPSPNIEPQNPLPIVPGERIGPIAVGLSVAALRRTVGDPGGPPIEQRPFTGYGFVLDNGQVVLAVIDARTGEVSVVETSMFYNYPDLITKFAALASLGNPDMQFPNDHWCYNSGIMLDFSSSGNWSKGRIAVGPSACQRDWIGQKP